MHRYASRLLSAALSILTSFNAFTHSLTPPGEPKNDSFYICYENRLPNEATHAVFSRYCTYKYLGCVISRVPCHLICGDEKFGKSAPKPRHQFQWVNTYPKALNSFYRCAYS